MSKADILIVDDEANTLASLSRAFRLAGHEAAVCDNAGRALELAQTRQFDLILADPPYGEKNVNRRSLSFAQQLLDDSSLPKLLAAGGRFMLGHTKRDTLEIVPPWTEVKMLKHGDTVMRFFEIES